MKLLASLSFERILLVGLIMLLASYVLGFTFASYMPPQTVKYLGDVPLFRPMSFALKNQIPTMSEFEGQRLFLTSFLFFWIFFLAAIFMTLTGFIWIGKPPFIQRLESLWTSLGFSAIYIWVAYFPNARAAHSGLTGFITYTDFRYVGLTGGFLFLLMTCFQIGYIFGGKSRLLKDDISEPL